MAEELIAGFMSPNLKRGKLRGYGIYLTTERIIGVKGGWKQVLGVVLGAVLGSGGGAVFGPVSAGLGGGTGYSVGQQLSMDKATKTLEWLERKKDFEVRREELRQVRLLQKMGGSPNRQFTYWGDLTIETDKETYRIRVLTGGTGDVQVMKDMFSAFCTQEFLAVEWDK